MQPVLDTLDVACTLSDNAQVRFAAMCAEFTADNAAALSALCQRLRIPNNFSEAALQSARFTEQAHDALKMNAEQLHTLIKSLDVARRGDRFNDFLVAAQAHHQTTRTESDNYPQAKHLRACASAMASIDAAQIAKSQTDKSQIATAIKRHEINAIEAYLSTH